VANQVTCQDNLTVTGVLECQDNVAVTGQVAAQSMFCNTDLTVLGNLYAPSAYWVQGSFDGANLSILSSTGRHPFSLLRPSGASTGLYRVVWDVAHPSGSNYTIQLTAENGFAYIRGRQYGPITEFGFDVITRDGANFSTLANRIVHVTVL
jgi:hypothetical protein